MKPKRYRNLLKIIYNNRCKTIMEIGTYNGIHACQMIKTASIFHPINQIEYYGFDLFEKQTDEDFQKEFSKRATPYNEVKQRLDKTGANIHLYIGYSKDTLPQFLQEHTPLPKIDFVFIDGGHSFETIESDWNYVKEIMNPDTIVVFDDYLNNSEPEVSNFGCQTLINKIDKTKYNIDILEPEDHFNYEWGILKTRMVKVKLR